MSHAVVFDEFGGPEVLHLADLPARAPDEDEVRVRIEAFAVNPLDLMMRAGTYFAPIPLPGARLGVEGTGVVDAVGPGVGQLAVGDPVLVAAVPDAWAGGTYAEHLTLPASRLVPRPAGLDVAEAAAVWVGFSTAYGALVEKAGVQAGDHVLVNAATGAVGRAVVQVARQLGAVPIAVTRSSAKRQDLLDAGAAVAVATDADDLRDTVLAATGGAGADVVIDVVGGQGSLAAAARPGATLLVAGFLEPRGTSQGSGGRQFESYRGFAHTLDPAVVARMAAFLENGLRQGDLRPRVGAVLGLDDVAEAHRAVESGAVSGKTVVTL